MNSIRRSTRILEEWRIGTVMSGRQSNVFIGRIFFWRNSTLDVGSESK
jgi:hypothetical protein